MLQKQKENVLSGMILHMHRAKSAKSDRAEIAQKHPVHCSYSKVSLCTECYRPTADKMTLTP